MGSVTFEYSSSTAFKKGAPAGIIMQIPAGGHLFRLERTATESLRFYHSSPGTGTRVAAIDLTDLPEFDRAFFGFTWSPDEMSFYCGPRIAGAELISAKGASSPREFRIANDGSVFELGDEGVRVMGIRVHKQGNAVLRPTAIQAWQDTREAIGILWSGKSDQGYIFEVVLANLTLAILVTGLEAYAGTRLAELESEGIEPDADGLLAAFSSKAERESGIHGNLRDEAKAAGQSVLGRILESGRINFQIYDHIKRAYRASYGIKLGEIGLSSQHLEELQRFIAYRHRVVHVSALLGILNEGNVPPQEPAFASRMLAERAINCFENAIANLHKASLGLTRKD